MEYTTKEIKALGEKMFAKTFYDVNLFPNSRQKDKVIITCNSDHARKIFLKELDTILKAHTTETLEFVSGL